MKDQVLFDRAWSLIENQTKRSVDGVGLLPWRPHDVWSAISAVAPDFESYYRLNSQMAEKAQALFGVVGLAGLADLPDHQLRHVFQQARAGKGRKTAKAVI